MTTTLLIKWMYGLAAAVLVVTVLTFWAHLGYFYLFFEDEYVQYNNPSVAVVTVRGPLDLVSDPTRGQVDASLVAGEIQRHSRNPDVEVIVLDIYSYGGKGVAGEMVMNALKRSPKKTIALLNENVISTGYLAATGADEIYASRFTTVGGIGVTSSYVNESGQNMREGREFVGVSSAPFKNLYNPYKPLTQAGRVEMQRVVDELHELFVATVAENRGLGIETVTELATGASFLPEEALEYGLIDGIGDMQLVLDRF